MPPLTTVYSLMDEYPFRPGELLSDLIFRTIETGVGFAESNALSYDETDDGVIDPSSDIRTDPFAVAEDARNSFDVRRLMTEQAVVSDTDIPAVDSTVAASTDSPSVGPSGPSEASSEQPAASS